MSETTVRTTTIKTPIPVEAIPIAAAVPCAMARPVVGVMQAAPVPTAGPREGCCIASAICGLTGIVPVFSQLAGLGLGIAGLVRIRRARRRGIHLRGTGWAITGIASSGFALMCWVGLLVAFGFAGATFSESAGDLQSVIQSMQGL